MPIQNGIQLQRKLDEINAQYNNGTDPSALLELITIRPQVQAVGGFARSQQEWKPASRNYDMLWIKLHEEAEKDETNCLREEINKVIYLRPHR